MELHVREHRHLLAQMLDGTDGIKPVEGTFEGKMGVCAVQHLYPGVEDVESLAPGQLSDSRLQLLQGIWQGLAKLAGKSRFAARAGFSHVFSRHTLTPVEISEAVKRASVEPLAVDVIEESLVMDQRGQAWNHHLGGIRRRPGNRHGAAVWHVQS